MPQTPRSIWIDPRELPATAAALDLPELPEAPAGPDADLPSRLRSTLPVWAGMLGGLLGNVPGAALGAAGGEALRSLLEGERDPITAALNMVKEAAGQGVAQLGGQALGAGARQAGRAVYGGYLKPSLSQRLLPQRERVIETALRQGLPMTKTGAARLRARVNALDTAVAEIADEAEGRISIREVGKKIRVWAAAKYGRSQGTPVGDYKAALEVADAFEQHPANVFVTIRRPVAGKAPEVVKQIPQPVSVGRANRIRKDTWQSIAESKFGTKAAPAVEAEKQQGRFIRDAILERALKARPALEEEAALMKLKRPLETAVGRESNRSALFGVPSVLAGMGGAGYGAYQRDPASGIAMALAIRAGLAPAVATRAAILAYRLGQLPGAVPATAARLALADQIEALERQLVEAVRAGNLSTLPQPMQAEGEWVQPW